MENESCKNRKNTKKLIIIISVAIIAVVGIVLASITVVNYNKTYDYAVEMMNNGFFGEAIKQFGEIANYKDSKSKIEKIESFREYKEGDIFTFGAFEQDDDEANGKEPIEWIIIEKNHTSLKLVSRKVLFNLPFVKERARATWETSFARGWLNNNFLKEAFTEKEQSQIIASKVSPSTNPDYEDVSAGNATEDKVFILSYYDISSIVNNRELVDAYQENTGGLYPFVTEATKYALNNRTAFASEENAELANRQSNAYIMLRTPGNDSDYISFFQVSSLNSLTYGVRNNQSLGILPVLWLQILE